MGGEIVLTQPSRPLQDLAADWDVGDQLLLQGLVQVCLPRSNIPEVEIVSLKIVLTSTADHCRTWQQTGVNLASHCTGVANIVCLFTLWVVGFVTAPT